MQFNFVHRAVCVAQFLLAAMVVHSGRLPLNKYIIMDYDVSFFEAWRSCQFYGLELASVTSAEDNRELSELVNMSGRGNGTFWLAGTDIGREGKWIWITTNKLVVLYSHWGNISPEFHESQNCMAIGSFDNDRTLWDDVPCNEPHRYICQKV